MVTLELTVTSAFKALVESAAADNDLSPSQLVQDLVIEVLQQQLQQQQVISSATELF